MCETISAVVSLTETEVHFLSRLCALRRPAGTSSAACLETQSSCRATTPCAVSGAAAGASSSGVLLPRNLLTVCACRAQSISRSRLQQRCKCARICVWRADRDQQRCVHGFKRPAARTSLTRAAQGAPPRPRQLRLAVPGSDAPHPPARCHVQRDFQRNGKLGTKRSRFRIRPQRLTPHARSENESTNESARMWQAFAYQTTDCSFAAALLARRSARSRWSKARSSRSTRRPSARCRVMPHPLSAALPMQNACTAACVPRYCCHDEYICFSPPYFPPIRPPVRSGTSATTAWRCPAPESTRRRWCAVSVRRRTAPLVKQECQTSHHAAGSAFRKMLRVSGGLLPAGGGRQGREEAEQPRQAQDRRPQEGAPDAGAARATRYLRVITRHARIISGRDSPAPVGR